MKSICSQAAEVERAGSRGKKGFEAISEATELHVVGELWNKTLLSISYLEEGSE